MFNLFKLELKRFSFGFKFLISILCNLVILGITCLIFFAEKDSFGNDVESFTTLLQLSSSLIFLTFMVFAGVLISSMITSEYKNRTIMLLYTYPISRRNILLSKLLLIFAFTFFSMIFASVFIFSIFYIILLTTNSLGFAVPFEVISNLAVITLISALKNSVIALIPVSIGIKTKSMPATIISGFLIAGFLHSSFNGFNIGSIFLIPLFFIAVSIGIIYFVLQNVNSKDIN